MLAFSYTTLISALIHLRDHEPEKTEEAIRQRYSVGYLSGFTDRENDDHET